MWRACIHILFTICRRLVARSSGPTDTFFAIVLERKVARTTGSSGCRISWARSAGSTKRGITRIWKRCFDSPLYRGSVSHGIYIDNLELILRSISSGKVNCRDWMWSIEIVLDSIYFIITINFSPSIKIERNCIISSLRSIVNHHLFLVYSEHNLIRDKKLSYIKIISFPFEKIILDVLKKFPWNIYT